MPKRGVLAYIRGNGPTPGFRIFPIIPMAFSADSNVTLHCHGEMIHSQQNDGGFDGVGDHRERQ